MDDDARGAWRADPTGYSFARLDGDAATMVAGLDPVGLEAMAQSHLTKKDRFDYFHRLHHEHLDRQAGLAHTHADGTTHAHEDHH
jgi:hypothetical protein